MAQTAWPLPSPPSPLPLPPPPPPSALGDDFMALSLAAGNRRRAWPSRPPTASAAAQEGRAAPPPTASAVAGNRRAGPRGKLSAFASAMNPNGYTFRSPERRQ
jgi:hypothetical protein